MNLYYEIHGDPSPQAYTVVLLHGMVGSGKYWRSLIALNTPKIRYIVIDLLGFGQSPKPTDMLYDYPTHLSAIDETITTAIGTDRFCLVGHSMGALLALRYAAEHTTRVDKLVLSGLPYYKSVDHARREITQSNIIRKYAYYGRTSHLLCTLWCRLLRPISIHTTPYYLRHIPAHVARDTLLHTWQSYSQSMAYIIEQQSVINDLTRLQLQVDCIYGETEACREILTCSVNITNITNIRFISYPNEDHQLVLSNPQIIEYLLLVH